MWDRNDIMDRFYKKFLSTLGCETAANSTQNGLDCARGKSIKELRLANEAVQNLAPRGSFGLGPSTDGSLIRQLASVEFLQGQCEGL
jgi:hypothetical protein